MSVSSLYLWGKGRASPALSAPNVREKYGIADKQRGKGRRVRRVTEAGFCFRPRPRFEQKIRCHEQGSNENHL